MKRNDYTPARSSYKKPQIRRVGLSDGQHLLAGSGAISANTMTVQDWIDTDGGAISFM